MEPALMGMRRTQTTLTLAIVLVLAVLVIYGVLRFTRTAVPLLQPQAVLGTPLTVAVGTTTPPWTNSDDTYIPWETAIPRDKVAQVRALMRGAPVPVSDAYGGLFIRMQDDPSAGGWPSENYPVHYFDDGVIAEGTYAGYHRLIAEYPSDGPSTPSYFWFATKDYQTYIAYAQIPDAVPNPGFVNTAKVTGADDFPIAFPETQTANPEFMIAKSHRFENGYLSTSTPRDSGELRSLVKDTRLLARPVSLSPATTSPQEVHDMDFGSFVDPSPEYANFIASTRKYLDSTTLLTQCDKTGVCFGYNLSFARFATSSVMRPGNEYGSGGPYDTLEIAPGTQDPKMYPSYGNLFPAGCGSLDASWSYTLKNVSDADVVDTGRSWLGVELYTFAHPESHPLVKAEYDFKKRSVLEEGSPNGAVPDFATYIQKDPILLFKDPWGRWVAVGEHVYMPPGGCGKPVVYLYPASTETVSVQFVKPPSFTVDIPAYHDGWKVLAHPDGNLTDLQPGYTDCSVLSDKKGAEYATEACHKNIYPYLYWAGHADGTYPRPSGGWVVRRDELDSFLRSTLGEIGLNARESDDMRSFWVPELAAANAPYYRLSFITTAQMNAFIPMRVTPRPQSTLRVFLDWSSLSEKPATLPRPQQFAPFSRNGFTLVEWGGLERK